MTISVCVSSLFGGQKPEEAMVRLKNAGFSHVEMWGWWDKDVSAIARAEEETGISVEAICTRFVSLTDPSRRAEYLKGLEETVETCRILSCPRIISQTGQDTGEVRAAQYRSLVDGMKEADRLLAGTGLTLTVEPLNEKDHPGYYLRHSKEAFDAVREVSSPRVRVLYDIYHQGMTGEKIEDDLRENIGLIGHFHAAGVPGRREPDGGRVDYRARIEEIVALGYDGSFGLEYFPAGDPVASLTDLKKKWADLKGLGW
ncbi:MAG: TIM barrel protein [Clostridia bacterium]|nr:TIM barrel protein [Clostridia bacterium]